MDRFLKLLLANSVFANMLLVMIFFVGISSIMTMEKEGFPAMELDIITVSIVYPGASAEEVEEGIILKMESALQGIDGIKKKQFIADEGIGSAMIECYSDNDLQTIKEDINSALDGVLTFPEDAEKPRIVIINNPNDVIKLSLWGESDAKVLKECANDIAEEILQIDGIKRVKILGEKDYELNAEINEFQLLKHDLTIQEVALAMKNRSLDVSGGSIYLEKETIKLRVREKAYTKKEFENILIRKVENGPALLLKDIANVKDDFVESGIFARFNGKPALVLDIQKGDKGDTIDIVKLIRDRIEIWRAKVPENIQLTLWADMSKLIEGRINLLTGNGMVGLMLVVLALWLFMDLKLSFWVGMGIPISLLGGLGIIAFFGHSINMLNLFGMIMVLGIIVDDAIVVGESIYVKSCEGLSPIDAAIQGTKEVFWPVVAAVTTTIVAFIPLFYVPGIMGKFIGVIPPIVVGALVISLVESLFLLPIHLKNLKTTEKIIKGDANFFVKLGGKVDIIRKKFQQMLTFMINKLYTPLLKKCLHFRYLAMAFTSVLIFLVSALVMSGKIKYLTFPDIDSDYLVASVEFPVGTSIEKTSEAVKKLEEAWFEVDNFYEKEKGESITKAVLANIGTIMGQKTINGDHIGQILLELMPAEKRNVYHKVLAQKWRDCLEGIEGAITVRIETIKHGPPGKDLEIWFLSNDPKTLEHSSAELVRYLEKMEGVVDIDSSLRDGKTEFLLTLKPSAHYHNISLAQVAKAVRDRYYGNEVMRMQRGRDEVKINIRLSRNERESVENLKSVKIKTQSGDIPLSYFVHIEVKKELFKIERTRGKRKVAVTASIYGGKDNTTPTEVLNVLRKELFPQMRENYDDLNISEEGKANESKESNEGMVSGLLMALLGIYLIVATVFKSYIQPVVVMLVIPLGMVGAVIGHMILDIPLSMFSFFGIVALTGIVVNDSIIMVEGINGNLDKGKDLKDALISSGIRRFRPIILTTLTTSAGLFPMILERSMQAQFLIPMAVSLVFGVIFATGLTLIIIPCLYNILNDFRRIFYWHLTGVWSSREFVEPRFK